MGPPNCGKGTLVKEMEKRFGKKLGVIPVGAMVEKKLAQDERAHKGLIEQKDSGGLLPTNFIVELVEQRIAQLGRLPIRIFDGFPRRMDQVDPFIHITRSLNPDRVVIVHIKTDEEVCIKRAGGRGRRDDRRIRERLDNFRKETSPVVDYFWCNFYVHGYSFVPVSGNNMFQDSNEIVDHLIKEAGILDLLPQDR